MASQRTVQHINDADEDEVLQALVVAQDAATIAHQTVKTLRGEIDEEMDVPILKKDPRMDKAVGLLAHDTSNSSEPLASDDDFSR